VTNGPCSPVITAIIVDSASSWSKGGRPSTAVNSVAPSAQRSASGPGRCRGPLGGDVRRRPEQQAGGGDGRVAGAGGDAEVGEHHPAVVAHHHVGRLHVAVHDPLRVRRLQRAEQRQADLRRARRVERALGRDDVREGARLDQLHDEVGRAVVLDDVVDGHRARVVQAGGGPRLAPGALAQHVAVDVRHAVGKVTSLTRTSRPSTSSRARQTVPMPPAPRRDSSA
jgi:hypothetical protein